MKHDKYFYKSKICVMLKKNLLENVEKNRLF